MVIGNGVIIQHKDEVLPFIELQVSGEEVREVPYPFISDSMKYYVSVGGTVFGCKAFKEFSLVTRIKTKIMSNGCPSIRVSVSGAKQHQLYLDEVVFNSFQKHWVDNILLVHKDGSFLNCSINNLEMSNNKNSVILVKNVARMKNIYSKYFNDVVRNIIWYSYNNISEQDAKDIASDTFLELCGRDITDYPYHRWLCIAKKRTIDRSDFNSRFELYMYDDGDEKASCKAESYEFNPLKHLSGKRTLEYMQAWSSGKSCTEIAKEYKVSVKTIYSTICRSLQNLKRIYKSDIISYKRR